MHTQSKIRNRLNSIKCESKIKLVDKHIRRVERLPSSMFMNPELRQHYQKQKELQHYQQMTPLQIKSQYIINFNNFTCKKFIIYNNGQIPKDKVCVIRVTSPNILTTVHLLIDEKINRAYRIKQPKGILIKEEGWKTIQAELSVSKKGQISIVKIEVDTIKIQFRSKSAVTFLKKEKIREEIQNFIEDNRYRIQDIVQKRKEKTSSVNFLSRNSSSAQLSRRSQSSRNIWTASSVQDRRNFINLEKSKSQVLRHIKKMSPQKSFQLMDHSEKFRQTQVNQFRKIVSMIYVAGFANHVYGLKVKLYAKKIHNIKIRMICQKFINVLKQKNRGKNSLPVKAKLGVMAILPMFATISHETIYCKAEVTLGQQIRPVMWYSSWINMSKKVQAYHVGIRFVQDWWRRKRFQLNLKRIRMMKEKQVQYSSQQGEEPADEQSQVGQLQQRSVDLN